MKFLLSLLFCNNELHKTIVRYRGRYTYMYIYVLCTASNMNKQCKVSRSSLSYPPCYDTRGKSERIFDNFQLAGYSIYGMYLLYVIKNSSGIESKYFTYGV